MIARLSFLAAASLAAYAFKKNSVKPPGSSALHTELSEKGEANNDQHQSEEENEECLTYPSDSLKKEDGEEREAKEEFKSLNGVMSPGLRSPSRLGEDAKILYEFEDLLSKESELLSFPTDNFHLDLNIEEARFNETEMESNACELERLRNLVKELEERELELEGEMLEYYGLKEQESDIIELQQQLKIQTDEINMLHGTISDLQAERKKLQEEVADGVFARKVLDVARNKIQELQMQIQLQADQTKGQLLLLEQQVLDLQAKEEEARQKDAEDVKKLKDTKELQAELMELNHKFKELQHEKRDLTVKLDVAEARVTTFSALTESENVNKINEEVSDLRHANEDLLKRVEELQMNRFSDVEELVYLRWVNACLRFQLRNCHSPAGTSSALDLGISYSPKSQERAKQMMLDHVGSEHGQDDTDLENIFSQSSSPSSEDFDKTSMNSTTPKNGVVSKISSLIKKLRKWGTSKDDSSILSSSTRSFKGVSPRGPLESFMQQKAGGTIRSFGKIGNKSTVFPQTPPMHIPRRASFSDSLNTAAASFPSRSIEGVFDERYPLCKGQHKMAVDMENHIILLPTSSQIKENVVVNADLSDQSTKSKTSDSETASTLKFVYFQKRPPRVFKPPPKPSQSASIYKTTKPLIEKTISPPLPPPPPSGNIPRGQECCDKVHRAPELVEFYQSLMKRETKKNTQSLISPSTTAKARSNIIGEIENQSTFLLAVKADVENQGDFVQSLAAEVRAVSFSSIEDLVAFVNWLDEELSFLVDERAVLKHFDWPEGKADAIREASFQYQDLMKLEKLVSSFVDDPTLTCEHSLKKMYSVLEKVEQSVYALLQTRDTAVSRYKVFGIPVDWLSECGVVGKIKLSSVKLARKYMKRVTSELDTMSGLEQEANREFIILQGVRFAFRVHQFAGGFDVESMKTFEELRSRIHTHTS